MVIKEKSHKNRALPYYIQNIQHDLIVFRQFKNNILHSLRFSRYNNKDIQESLSLVDPLQHVKIDKTSSLKSMFPSPFLSKAWNSPVHNKKQSYSKIQKNWKDSDLQTTTKEQSSVK